MSDISPKRIISKNKINKMKCIDYEAFPRLLPIISFSIVCEVKCTTCIERESGKPIESDSFGGIVKYLSLSS